MDGPTETEINQSRAEELGNVLRRTVANLLRVMRGSGHPEYLARELLMVAGCIEAYRRVHGHMPENIGGLLDHRPDDMPNTDRDLLLVNGVLQLVASNLLGDRRTAWKGQQEINQGILRRQEWEDVQRQIRELERQ